MSRVEIGDPRYPEPGQKHELRIVTYISADGRGRQTQVIHLDDELLFELGAACLRRLASHTTIGEPGPDDGGFYPQEYSVADPEGA